MTIAPLLIKMHEDQVLTTEELELVHKTATKQNLNIDEAITLYLWSSCSAPLQEYIKCGNTYSYVANTLDQLALRLLHLTPDGEEVRYILEALQNICYADKTLGELYTYGARLAPNNAMRISILAAIREIHIAVHAPTIVSHLYSAIIKNGTNQPLTVYRAMKELVEDETIINKGLMSTSLRAENSFAKYPEYKTVFKLHVPADTKCINITPFSVYDVVESEVLFPPNVIHVTERTVCGDKTYITGNLEILDDFA